MNISALIWLMKYGNRLQQINTHFIFYATHYIGIEIQKRGSKTDLTEKCKERSKLGHPQLFM